MTSAAVLRSLPKHEFKSYLEIDSNGRNPHEFYQGVIFPVFPQSQAHNTLRNSSAKALSERLHLTPHRVLGAQRKIRTPDSRAAFYPDLVVVRHRSPQLILEVLSSSSRGYDLTTKRDEYLRIPSLRHYLTLDSESIEARLFTRDTNQTWPKDPQIFTDPKALISLSALRIKVKLKDLYSQTDLLA